MENIAARLYSAGGVEVQTRAMLPPARGAGRRSREIDVLVTRRFAGNAIRYAIECKNESKAIEAGAIDGFAGKLMYLGFETAQGIFVSRSRFTRGAIERAEDAGIRLYRVTGIRDDGLTIELHKAFQSVVYLLLSTGAISLSKSINGEAGLVFVDTQGKFKGFFADLVYRMWRSGTLPTTLGEHTASIDIPPGWMMGEVDHELQKVVLPDPPIEVYCLQVTITITAVVFTAEGKWHQHSLVCQPMGHNERTQINASWKQTDHDVTLKTLVSDEDLQAHLDSIKPFHLVVRNVRLPRIQVQMLWGAVYWPPSEASARQLFALHASGQEPYPADIEGSAFNRFFDDVWEGYPGAYEDE